MVHKRKILGRMLRGAVLAIAAMAIAYTGRYGNRNIDDLTLRKYDEESQSYSSNGTIQFQENTDGTHSVRLNISGQSEESLVLQNIDLSLLIPTMPQPVQGNTELGQWFLSEREFNRQRVMFQPGSERVVVEGSLGGHPADTIGASLTNNCLGAGYWEVAVFAEGDDGQDSIYQGYFEFPKGAYGQLIEGMNPETSYWQHARAMEAWPGFSFHRGMPFELDRLRTVEAEWQAVSSDSVDSSVISFEEQESKVRLIANQEPPMPWDTYGELREQPLQFHSFVPPGVYESDQLWKSDFGEINRMVDATVRSVSSPLVGEELTEIELEFTSDRGQSRYLVVGGIDLESVPQLPAAQYSDGVYRPLGFGVPFTQDYEELEQARPEEDPFFSVLLDEKRTVMDYRRDVGLNGLVLHRDVVDPHKLHLYLMSYERITLVGHYVIHVDLPSSAIVQVPTP